MPPIGPQQLDLAEDYAQALEEITSNSVDNLRKSLRRAMVAILRDLRRYYPVFTDPAILSDTNYKGDPRRPFEYSIADSTKRLDQLLKIARGFMTEKQLTRLDNIFKRDLARAAALGDELAGKLLAVADPSRVTPFGGASKGAIEAASQITSAYIRGEVASFRNQLTQIVTNGLSQGKGWRFLYKDVQTALRGAKDPQGLNQRMGVEQRAELIARSEIANAYVRAQQDSAQRNGFSLVRWVATEDELTCPLCASRNGKIYKLGEVVAPAHPRCVLGHTKVSPGAFATAIRGTYSGNVVTVTLQGGSRFTVTANHPMLTPAGWVKAKTLRHGDQLLCQGLGRDVTGSLLGPDLNEVPATAEEVFTAFLRSGSVTSIRMPTASVNLHGDGGLIEGKIEIVDAGRFLEGYWVPKLAEDGSQAESEGRTMRFREFLAPSNSDALCLGLNAAACGVVSRLGEAHALLRGGLSHAEIHRLTTIALLDTTLPEAMDDDGARNPEMLREFLDAYPGMVELQEVVDVEIVPWHGDVFTFSSFPGTYTVGDTVRAITGNCRCSLSPVNSDPDGNISATALDEEFWNKQRMRGAEALAKAKGWDMERTLQEMDKALRKPTPSEKRLYPTLEEAIQPVA